MAAGSSLDRLREHAQSFDGLLSLIPAKLYYGEGDNSDQWKKKKQTKAEAAAAQRAKLDPDSAKTAKEIMDERAKKRKLDDVDNEGAESDIEIEGVEKEQPRQGMKEQAAKSKKLKTQDGEAETAELNDEAKIAKAAAKKERQQRKKEKRAQKLAEKKSKREGKPQVDGTITTDAAQKSSAEIKQPIKSSALPAGNDKDSDEEEDVSEDEEPTVSNDMNRIDIGGLVDKKDDGHSQSSNSSPASPVFDAAVNQSTNTSTSSIIPPATAPKHIKLPSDPELLRSRLAARIEALRAARKADGPNGAPARTRQELMEARRKKEEQRRAHKKELRLKAKIEEEKRREEALASARDSPVSGLMSPAIQSPENNFSFGRVTFGDGEQLKDDLSGAVGVLKKKGPRDPASALAAAQKQQQRIAGLDDGKRADIEEKEMWLTAKKHAHGEKVRDDVSLLKKALKRKEKQKKKSEKEWTERKEGVAKSQFARQKKREDNLRKRREEKGVKGKKAKAKAKKAKPKSRPGFEGAFTSGKRH